MVYCFPKGRRVIKSWFEKTCSRHISSSNTNFIRVIFFGTDIFSLGTLNALNEIRLNSGVITDLDVISSGKARYIKKNKDLSIPHVIRYANTFNLNAISWEKVKKEKRFEKEYDLCVVASFGDFIPGHLLSSISKGAINIHPSLLPRWRGPAPIIHTILAGDTYTGISIIEVSKKRFDIGKILYQQEYKVPYLSTSAELLTYLSEKSGELIPYVINNVELLQKNAKFQCESLATHAPKVTKSTGYIDFAKHSSSYLQRLQRALPQNIGIRACWDGKDVKLGHILNIMEDFHNCKDLSLGGCFYDKPNRLIWIKLVDGFISINTMQFEYKKEISAVSFYNGYIINKQTGIPGVTKFESIT